MKNIYLVLFIFLSVLSIHCQKEIDHGTGNGNNNTSPAPITATLQGNILDENGQPAIGVTVKVGTKMTSTDARGYFRIVAASLDKNLSLVTAEKTGYFKAYRTFSATSGVNHVVIKLIREELAGNVSSTTGGDITLTNGTKISLAPNSMVKAAGGTYSGTVNVYAAFIDPTATDISLTVPGSFVGENEAGNRGILRSFGMLAVELRSPAGEELQLAAGSTATLTMPIPASLLATAPATIPLWYVDEQTGLWKEEGTATKNGNNYIGQVTHFSFWNVDAFNNAILLSMTLRTNEANPLVNAQVKLTRTNGSSSYGWTDSLGQVSGYIPSNETLAMQVMGPYPCTNIIFSQNIGPFTQNTNLGVITVNGGPSSEIITLTGRLMNCSNNPVTNGYAIIYHGNSVRYAAVNSTGNFTTTIVTCTSSPNTCEILGVDNGAQQQGSLVIVNLVAPLTNAGNISACGTSALQFINYNLNGTNYSISTAVPGDSITSYTVDSTTSVYVYITGMRPPNVANITFTYSAPSSAPGNYPVGWLSVQNMMAQMIPPFNVTVTNFPPNIGGYHEGTFSGQFTDAQNPGPTHTITGSYRIRRQ